MTDYCCHLHREFLLLQDLLEDISEHLKIKRSNLEPLFGTDHDSSVQALHNAMKVIMRMYNALDFDSIQHCSFSYATRVSNA